MRGSLRQFSQPARLKAPAATGHPVVASFEPGEDRSHLRWSSGQMVNNVALVLGGGGSAGHAWTIGVIAGLAEAGIDMNEAADLVVGTSSGANAAAQVRSGIPPAELLASILSQPVPPVGQK